MQRSLARGCFLLIGLLFLSFHTGCIARFAATLMHAGMGNKVPPKYSGCAVPDRKIAIVCLTQSSSFGSTTAAESICENVIKYLRNHIEEINLVDQQEIDRWMDENDWNQIDYRELGQGVGADVLVAIDIRSFSLHEGKTLYKGRADVEITVYDLGLNGKIVFEEAPPEIQYPVTAGFFTSEISESEFQKQFVDFVAYRIARNFYPYELSEDFGRDPSSVGF